jgi:hypothetical protein
VHPLPVAGQHRSHRGTRRARAARCYVEVGDTTTACNVLNRIPEVQRPIHGWMLLGELNAAAGMVELATRCYQEVISVTCYHYHSARWCQSTWPNHVVCGLGARASEYSLGVLMQVVRRNPYAIEATLALTRLRQDTGSAVEPPVCTRAGQVLRVCAQACYGTHSHSPAIAHRRRSLSARRPVWSR